MAAVAGLFLFVSAYFFTSAGLLLCGLFYVLMSSASIIAEGRLQRETDSSHRATVLSVNSLLINLSGLLILAAFGALSEMSGMRTGFLAMAVLTVAAGLIFLFASKKRL